MAIFPGSAIPSAASDYTIDQSLRFDDGDSAYLSRTWPSDGNNKTWTWSCWIKRGNSTFQKLFDSATASQNSYFTTLSFNGDQLEFYNKTSSGVTVLSSQVFRDPSAWYHIMLVYDSTQSTDTNRTKIYVNGSLITLTGTYVSEDQVSYMCDDSKQIDLFRRVSDGGSSYFDGYAAELNFIDGLALTPSDLGETDSATNQWKPIEYTGTYGTNGFYQKYSVSELTCDYLIVGGGARGDQDYGAWGGGGGGVQTDTDEALSLGTYAVVVGATSTGAGNNSSFNSVTANGGAEGTGQPGTGGASGAPQSNAGGTGHSASYAETGGAGGGAGAVGGNSDPSTSGGVGGVGVANDFHTGSDIMYGAGGSGGGTRDSSGGAAADGGGSGGNNSSAGTSPPANRGGGGGGNNSGTQQSGAAGVVVIRYKSSSQLATGGTVTSYTSGDDTYQVHTFTSNGSFVYDGGIGSDSSGNNNNFTIHNLVATDVVKDTPTNNFCTWNLISGNGSSLSEGNLKGVGQLGATKSLGWMGTIAPESGKWYWEVYCVTIGWEQWIGVMALSDPNVPKIAGQDYNLYANLGAYSYYPNGTKIEGDGFASGSTSSSYGNTWTNGDLIGIALDLDNGAIYFSKNGTWQNSGDPTSGASKTGAAFTSFTGNYVPFASGYRFHDGTESIWIANFGQDSSFAGVKTAQGNQDDNEVGDFYYDVPAGFLSMCASNFSDPSIKLPGDNFNTLLYSGDGATSRSLTGVGFEPGFTWIKSRTTGYDNQVFDVARGVSAGTQSQLSPNLPASAPSSANGNVKSFDSDGFSIEDGTSGGAPAGGTNASGESYASWSWKAGGTPTADNSAGAGATPTAGSVKIDGSNLGSALAGSIAATRLSANTTNGFSIVEYVGTGSGATIAHGLSVAPELFIIKKLTAGAWPVGSTVMGMNKYMQLNTDAAEATDTGTWNNTSPTASVWSIGADSGTNENTYSYIAYLFHSVEGYSKVGSYTGNGTAGSGEFDGTFVYTGFLPAWVMLKRYDDSQSWWMFDDKRNAYNTMNNSLRADTTSTTNTNYWLDMVSNGFKLRESSAAINFSTGEYLYMAFSHSPFKYANAR